MKWRHGCRALAVMVASCWGAIPLLAEQPGDGPEGLIAHEVVYHDLEASHADHAGHHTGSLLDWLKPTPGKHHPYGTLLPSGGMLSTLDWSYLDKPGEARTEYYEHLKRMHLHGDWVLDIGGQYRHQFKAENRRTIFTGAVTSPRSDAFTLNRTRLYFNVEYQDWLRGYIEYFDGVSFHEDLPPLPIDVNRSDLSNYFLDLKLRDRCCSETWLRIGRQELVFGRQRLLTPFPWANVRRKFDAVKAFTKGSDWDSEVFWGRFERLVHPYSFDQPDQSQWFASVNGTYKGFEDVKVSPYLFILREEDLIPGPGTGRGHLVGSGNADSTWYTPGLLIKGERGNFLYEAEGAIQFGNSGDQDIFAGMAAVGAGWKFPCAPLKPVVWAWYDYGSGDSDPFDSKIGTFNQLYPLAHAAYGFADLVGRQNAQDASLQLFLNPTKKLKFLVWYHALWLAESRDAFYNAGGVGTRQDTTGASGTELGKELDFLAIYNIRPGVQFQTGYAHFWPGAFLQRTGDSEDVYFYYTQFLFNF